MLPGGSAAETVAALSSAAVRFAASDLSDDLCLLAARIC